jgi:hypothetical protein
MFHYCARTSIANIGIIRFFSSIVAGIIALQSLAAAADPWSRVTKLKSETWVYVTLSDGKHLEGGFSRADASGMVVRTAQEETLPRDLVRQVAIDRSGRRWYSIPLAAVAGAIGFAAGYGIASRIECSDSADLCRKSKGIIVAGFTGVPAGFAYKATLGPSKKVIYNRIHRK